MKLNMGCGFNKIDGFINVDMFPDCNPDVILNLEKTPWPWDNNSVNEVMFNHSLEHLGAKTEVFLEIIKELYRICKHEAVIYINVPHPRHDFFMSDPTHVRVISPPVLDLLNRQKNDEFRKGGYANTPLAYYLGVDFVVKECQTVLDEPYLSQYLAGELTDAMVSMAVKEKNNVASEYRIIMYARKQL